GGHEPHGRHPAGVDRGRPARGRGRSGRRRERAARRCEDPPGDASGRHLSDPVPLGVRLGDNACVLRRLRIENLVLIREAELDFAPGLNAITGETGAGKTILAQSIGLLLGAKGDAGYIGANGTEAYVEAELDLPAGLLDEDELSALAELRPEEEEGLV